MQFFFIKNNFSSLLIFFFNIKCNQEQKEFVLSKNIKGEKDGIHILENRGKKTCC